MPAAQICIALGAKVYGYDVDAGRSEQARKYGVHSLKKEEVETAEHGCAPLHLGYDVVIECCGVAPARVMSVLATKRWGECSVISPTEGERTLTIKVSVSSLVGYPFKSLTHGTTADVRAGGYNDVTLQVSPWVIQKQLTIKGSWTCCEL